VRGSIPSTRLGEAAGQTVAVLQFIDGLLAGHTVALHGPTTVGRGRDATVVVPAAERAVSATHCRIRRTASGLWVLEDADSRGGTFLNRERLGPGARPVLGSGDVIGLGAGGPTVIFTLQSPEHAAAQATELYAVTLARVTAEAI
jgi:pSer/pThr/pTyr-binding forkhead associated (FHA) protein